jgi:UDP-glucose 4-epimerase
VLGAAPRTLIAPRRPGDPPRLVGSSERAQKLLGWTPHRSDLRQVIANAARHYDSLQRTIDLVIPGLREAENPEPRG